MTAGPTPIPADPPGIVRSMSEEETVVAGEQFGRTLKAGDVVGIFGPIGAGKTRFVRGVCRALGTDRNVSSPTFTLVHEYHAPGLAVYHFDFYRISSPAELAGIGFAEYLDRGDGVCLIEWADRVEAFLPGERYEVRMEPGDNPSERRIGIRKTGGVTR
jgi:tRNA threonylcarbamoyladenosine biosynthesis protein TsaE